MLVKGATGIRSRKLGLMFAVNEVALTAFGMLMDDMLLDYDSIILIFSLAELFWDLIL